MQINAITVSLLRNSNVLYKHSNRSTSTEAHDNNEGRENIRNFRRIASLVFRTYSPLMPGKLANILLRIGLKPV